MGDVITFGVGFERFGKGMAVSRAFDDKAGVWVAVRVLETLAEAGRAPGDFIAAATVQEEIGTRGAITSAYGVNPDVAVAFDVTHATDYPGIEKSKHGDIVCGGGPVIARGPNINPEVFERLVTAAEAEGLPYQIEAEPSVTGTDARSIQITRAGIPTGLVSVALRYMHTPTEVVCPWTTWKLRCASLRVSHRISIRVRASCPAWRTRSWTMELGSLRSTNMRRRRRFNSTRPAWSREL